ncbi:CAP domain-containing protein [Streptomyces sp. E11-3]|uniref:CAP domain-containing protein n=1 Tax=Streptomyces sp. E11-3 TaxID=3110112 RepID=UPI003981946F
MGRHRRSDAPSAVGEQHLAGDASPHGTSSHRRRKRAAAAPVRTGLLSVSAAVAMGALAVTSGLLPGGDTFKLGGDDGKVQADGVPDARAQGGATVLPDREETPASRGADRATPSAPSPSESSAKPSATPSKDAKDKKEQSTKEPGSGAQDDAKDKGEDKSEKAKDKDRGSPPRTEPAKPDVPAPAPSQATGAASAAEAEVLSLVNQERAKAGCAPVSADAQLATLAGNFSQDMADRGFFDHTDPDGNTPWDRADKAGIGNLGGENIARGQADARAVMESWMNSPGHRANILNCDYKTLGVGAHFASGGPWWTQNFGF